MIVDERMMIDRLCGDAVVAMVQAADLRRRDDASGQRWRDSWTLSKNAPNLNQRNGYRVFDRHR